jgi:putative peptidoglycan lipid II flippase
MLSRVLGIVREQVIAYYFGAGAMADVFVAAFRIPNLLRDFLAEGAFSAAFVPTFTSTLRTEGKQAAFELLNRVLTVLSLGLAFVCIVGIIITPQIAWVFSGGEGDTPDKVELLVTMARWMFPFLLLVSLAAALMGALNAFGHFGMPALAPAGFNVGVIGAAVFVSPRLETPVLALAWGVLAGGLLQWATQAVLLHRIGFRMRWQRGWRDARVRTVLRLMLPAAIGAAAVQVNVLAMTRFAWTLGDGPVAYLNYAFRILFVPLGVFAVAAATVGLPRLSEQVAAGDEHDARETYARTLQTVFFLVLPTAIAFWLFGEMICAALYQRGQFSADDAYHTARALKYYAIGLPAMAAVRVTAPVFYAHKDTRTPMYCGVASIVVNLVAMALLREPLGYAGLALAVAGSAVVQAGLLILLGQARHGPLRVRAVLGHCVVFAALGWLAVRIGEWMALRPSIQGLPLGIITVTLVAIATAGLVYIATTWMFGYRHLGAEFSLRRR